ncbi:hypothetical protein ACRAWF_09595 [Streptomyces sp. L7]
MNALTYNVLLARKGDGYAALLIAECRGRSQLPAVLADLLLRIDRDLGSTASEEETDDTVRPDETDGN